MNFDFSNVKIPKKIDSPISKAVIQIQFESDCSEDSLHNFLCKVKELLDGVDLDGKIEEQPVLMIPKEQREKDEDLKKLPYYSISSSNEQYSFAIGLSAMFFVVNKKYDGWKQWSSFFTPILEIVQKENFIKKIISVGDSCLDDIQFDDVPIMEHLNCNISILGERMLSEFSFTTHISADECDGDFIIHTKDENSLQISIACNMKKEFEPTDFFERKNDILLIPHAMNKKIFFSLLNKDFVDSHFNPQW